jgi:hypothetical protein
LFPFASDYFDSDVLADDLFRIEDRAIQFCFLIVALIKIAGPTWNGGFRP